MRMSNVDMISKPLFEVSALRFGCCPLFFQDMIILVQNKLRPNKIPRLPMANTNGRSVG
jgi:hypothetical protein